MRQLSLSYISGLINKFESYLFVSQLVGVAVARVSDARDSRAAEAGSFTGSVITKLNYSSDCGGLSLCRSCKFFPFVHSTGRMCGILACLYAADDGPEMRSRVLALSRRQRHRGPDW
jgi:hypothetical protein